MPTPPVPNRRQLLQALGAALLAGAGWPAAAATAGKSMRLGRASAFSFERLKDLARRSAASAYVPPPHPAPEIVSRINYDAWGKIQFDTDYALGARGPAPFPVTFFHLGMYFQTPVGMYLVDGGEAREILYEQDYFRMPADSPARQMPAGAGFAGLRIQERRDGNLDWRRNDWAAFLGASYFRAIGGLYQYGLSARGLALDTAVAGRNEEFPSFSRLYIDTAQTDASVTLYALLEGPSVAGAYRFAMTRGADVLMDIEATLYLRRPVERFGLAPLTSMYWFSETDKLRAVDWRPEVHDSDGLAIWAGNGERLWRPLNNPPHASASAFMDDSPRGFGLLQRDRSFDHYQDGVYYDRRPSVWVEPKGHWGRGSVQLIELATDDEIHDNIVALWVPERQPEPGTAFNLAYRLHWGANEPYPSDLARCVATRLGNGGQPGQPRPRGVRKFTVEFLGGPLKDLPFGVKPEMVVSASRGTVTDYRIIEPVPDGVAGHWRASFDLAAVEGADPVDLRLHLARGGRIISEDWLYQYHPF